MRGNLRGMFWQEVIMTALSLVAEIGTGVDLTFAFLRKIVAGFEINEKVAIK